MNCLRGQVTTLIGNEDGFEDGDYTTCQISSPNGIIFDSNNDCIVFTDFDNNNIRMISGIGDIPICSSLTTRREIGYEDGDCDSALFSHPTDICIWNYNGEIYYIIVDSGNKLIRSINIEKRIVNTIYGRDSSYSPLINPRCIAISNNNECYITTDNGITVISLVTHAYIDTIGNGHVRETNNLVDGNYKEAIFNHPDGIIYVNNCLFICDSFNHCIRKINLNNKTVKTLVGTGESGYKNGLFNESKLYFPRRLCYIPNIHSILFTDMTNTIRIINLNSKMVYTSAGSGDDGCFDGNSETAQFSTPIGICNVEYQMIYYICDSGNYKIRAVKYSNSSLNIIENNEIVEKNIEKKNVYANNYNDIIKDLLLQSKYFIIF